MKFTTFTTITWIAALSFDTATATAKFRKSSKSRKPIVKKCPPTVYFNLESSFLNQQLYNAGPPALGNQTCTPPFQTGPPGPNGEPPPFAQVCSGDRVIVSPLSVFEDEFLTQRVGFYTQVATYVGSPLDGGETINTNVIVFDEGPNAGSEVIFSGAFPLMDMNGTAFDSDYAIIGGVGDFVGVSGETSGGQVPQPELERDLKFITFDCF